jgi:small subunit ribosomal protein S20
VAPRLVARGRAARGTGRPRGLWYDRGARVARGPSRMPNIKQQKKRVLRSERERLENRRYRGTIKTYFRRLERAVEEGDAETVTTEHRALVAWIDKAAARGAIHRNTAARRKASAARLLGRSS